MMEILKVDATRSTPEIVFDSANNTLSIKGQSYPEDAFGFYEPLFKWIDQYLEQLNEEATVLIDFTLPYINTSSSKCIMMLLEKLEEAYTSGKKVTLNWYYTADNDSELECAEEFQEDLSLPFNIVPREE